jgi:hypothetical protein
LAPVRPDSQSPARSRAPHHLRHHSGVDGDALRDLCLTFRGAEETFPFGFETSAFKVSEKVFALSRHRAEQLGVSVKCEPLLAYEGDLLALARAQGRASKATDLLIIATASATGRTLLTLDDAQASLARNAGVAVDT